jgi:hypothetical protein
MANNQIEQVVVSMEQSIAMKNDDSVCIILAAPMPWTDNEMVIVSFLRKTSESMLTAAA